MVKQKYPLIVSSKAMKPCRETRRSLRVAAGTRDHLVDRVEDTLRQMSHSLGTKKERRREGGRLGDREGLIRRWFPRVDRWTGHTMLPMDARCRWWWRGGAGGGVTVGYASHSTRGRRTETNGCMRASRLLATVRPALPFPFLSLPLFSLSFRPFRGHLSSPIANPLFSKEIPELSFTIRVSNPLSSVNREN